MVTMAMARAQSVMATLQSQSVTISWADLVQLAGAAAVQEAGGPFINVVLGRKQALPQPARNLSAHAQQRTNMQSHKNRTRAKCGTLNSIQEGCLQASQTCSCRMS